MWFCSQTRGLEKHAWLGRPLDAVRAMESCCTKGLGLVFSSGGSGVLRRAICCCCRASRGLRAGAALPASDAGGDPTGVLPPDEWPYARRSPLNQHVSDHDLLRKTLS